MKMTPFIKITRLFYEEPYHLNLLLEASNDSLKSQLGFYTSVGNLIKLADKLEAFSGHPKVVDFWAFGSERPEDRFAYYFRFRVFTRDSLGHSAIHLRFNNNQDLPDREISEFCILVDPASINNLGKLIREFCKLEHEVLYWEPNNGWLFTTLKEAKQGYQDSPL
jgi:hypothetical protein